MQFIAFKNILIWFKFDGKPNKSESAWTLKKFESKRDSRKNEHNLYSMLI